jgi:glycosyltransferase involved in cell wall biosynthesis
MVVGFDLTWMNVENRSGGIFQYALRLISALAEFSEIDIVALIGPTGVGLFDHLKGHKHFRVILLDYSETLRKVIHSEAIDVIHTPLQFHLNLSLSVPMITTLHDLQHLHYPEFFTQEEVDFRDTHYRKSAEFSERVIVSFGHVKEDIREFYNIASEKIDVCPIGMPVPQQVDQGRFEEIRRKYYLAERYLLYPANTWRHKNHIGLLRALKLVHDNYEMKIPLVCTGHKEDYYSEIKTVSKELQLDQFVHFTGYIPEEDMALILKNATLVVIPTLYEAGSFPLMEAMANEVPVICSRVTSLPDTMGDPKFLFEPNNVAETAEKIAGILQDDKLLEENRENSRKRKTANSWEKVITHFVNTYEKAVEGFDQKRKISFYEDWIQNYDLLASKEIDGLRRSLKETEADRNRAVEEIHKRDTWLAEIRKDKDTAIQEIHKRDTWLSETRKDRDTAVEEIHKRDTWLSETRKDRDTAVEEIHKRDTWLSELRSDRDNAVQEIQKRDGRIAYLEEVKEQAFRVIPLVSIVTPVFNSAKWVEDCIKSVMSQDYPRIEHIIVDGGSTDGTLDICRRYDHLLIVSEKDRGQSHAINKGFAMARGEILAWLCADDEYEPGAVRAAVKGILSGNDVVMGYSRFIDSQGNFIADHPANIHPYYDHMMFVRFWEYNPISQPATFWTRKMWETCGPLRENLYFAMDYDLWLRMSQIARFERVDTYVAKYRIHPEAKCFADNYGPRIELIQVSRRYWPPRWNPGRWVLHLRYLSTSNHITQHYADGEALLNGALQHLKDGARFRALGCLMRAHLRHFATPSIPDYPISLERILEEISPPWLWGVIQKVLGGLFQKEKKRSLSLEQTKAPEAVLLLKAEATGYKRPQFRFWAKQGEQFVLLRDWGPEETYVLTETEGKAPEYGIHIRSGDSGDMMDQVWIKANEAKP